MTPHDIVRKIVGHIKPIGETNEDNRRYENLQVMTTLVEALILDLRDVADMQNCPMEVKMTDNVQPHRTFKTFYEYAYLQGWTFEQWHEVAAKVKYYMENQS